jgi:hypothetical protein
MAITYDTDWQIDGTTWQPACPDCHRRATPQGSFGQCSGDDWSVCYRDIGYVLSRTGPPAAPDREWPDWVKSFMG